VEIEQGYFTGTPTSDLTVVLARQRVFIDEMHDEDQEIVGEFWLRT
jgi:hypothetical protein